jgi:hypothetical protein
MSSFSCKFSVFNSEIDLEGAAWKGLDNGLFWEGSSFMGLSISCVSLVALCVGTVMVVFLMQSPTRQGRQGYIGRWASGRPGAWKRLADLFNADSASKCDRNSSIAFPSAGSLSRCVSFAWFQRSCGLLNIVLSKQYTHAKDWVVLVAFL